MTSTVFKDTLPSGLTLTAASMNGTVLTNVGTATQPQFNLGSLTGGAVRTITLTTSAAVARDTVQGPYLNAATVTPGTTPTTTSNTVRTDLIYPTLSKTVQNLSTGGSVGTSSTGLPGNVVEYCLNFANNGSLNLPSYVLNDTISSNTAVQRNAYDAVSGQTGSGVKVVQGGTTTYLASSSAFVTSNTLSVNLGTLNAGTSGQLCFQGKIQ
ncbi:hypothetical protein MF271_07660 [Deinococcus sp. KNUC1210]|uniref:hypothetical protein n=1 Tax=Deinococcus sp. KNUC1210 TaxID=2917691 RepID=UPI001EEFBE27|nr:hypothetical protein [Deinococcus sp. KNUC1210]ULH16857.1 hypothetical protein MF271_07660 [Deinococcus sp. KNUC1210]